MKSSVHFPRGTRQFLVGAVLSFFIAVNATCQMPVSPRVALPQENPSAQSEKTSKKKQSHAQDFLIRGTVFNEKALSLSGAELRIRVAGEKKYRWETYTNSRGEFAVRVSQGSEYEMLVHSRGFADQTRTVNAKGGGDEETVVFLMQPLAGGKK